MRRRALRIASLAAVLAALPFLPDAATPASAEPVTRTPPFAGSVIARKSGEEARFIEVGGWRTVDIRQDLLPGDVLRTNASGNLAIVFSDRTQVRLGRNSTLVVRKVGGGGGDTELSLEAGQLWARAERGGEGVAVATPAATAAIRGTDWSMQVDGSSKTSLIVLEGRVELANAQGSVTVSQGEGASAAIGQAPTKLAIVDPSDREQMLYYYSLRSAFTLLPASNLPSRDMRAERARIGGIPEASRSADDRVSFAEVSLSYDGSAAAKAAVAAARRSRPTAAQAARLDLVEALIAGGEQRSAEAARLFERAAPRLDPQRRAMALYGGYFSRSLADPRHVEAPPAASGGGRYAALAQAFTASFLQDVPAAIKLLREAETRFPDDPVLPAVRAQFASLLDDRAQARGAIARSLALDPDDPNALIARSAYRSGIESDLEGALDDIQRAAEVAPGSSTVWNNLGLVQEARGAAREAEAAFRRAIAVEPQDPVAYANLGVLLLDQDRLAEAKAAIDTSLTVDPSFDVGLTARGRLKLQTGDVDAGLQDLLAGSTANPAYSAALLLLAAGYHESGDREAAEQALDNADRLDPNDPVTPNFQTALAIDEYESDRAIASAQESLRRARARGGDYSALSANQTEGSTLNNAYRLQGLNAWGRFYGESVFDPFSATALVDQFVSGSPNPFVTDLDFRGNPTEPTFNNRGFSSFLQGLMLDPTIISSRTRATSLVRRPFLEGSLGGGVVMPDGGEAGGNAEAELQGFSAVPFPVSFYGNIAGLTGRDTRDLSGELDTTRIGGAFTLGDEDLNGSLYVAAKPTPADNVVAYLDYRRDGDNLEDGRFTYDPPFFFAGIPLDPRNPDGGIVNVSLEGVDYERAVVDRSVSSGVALSHSFGYRDVLGAAIFASGLERSSEEDGVLNLGILGVPGTAGTTTSAIDGKFRQSALTGAVSRMIGIGDLTLRFGAEGGRVAQKQSETTDVDLEIFELPRSVTTTGHDATFAAARAYVDALYEFSPALKGEAGIFGTYLHSGDVRVNGEDADAIAIERFEPRAGLSWEVLPGQLLRVGFIREAGAFTAASLAPNGIVGLQPNQLPLSVTARADTFAARWDAEWTSRFFTSLDYQHQDFDGLDIPAPATITTVDVGDGSLDRLSLTANYHLTGGFGLFGTLAFQDSQDETEGAEPGDPLPYLPELASRIGVTYVNPANLKVTLAATHVGERLGGPGGSTLDSYWTTDATLTWEPFGKRFELELAGYNLLDEDFDVANAVPGWNRTFTGSLKVRF